MNTRTSFHRASWLRLVALSLLLGLALLAGNLLSMGTAHAQSLSSVTITDCTDDSQLQSAITNASSGDTITFGCSGDIKLTKTLTIAVNLTLDGSGQNVTLDGGNSVRVIVVNSGVTLTLNALTIAHGKVASNVLGGGLDNFGTVTISNSTFANNFAGAGGGVGDESGSTVTISNSTFTNNTGFSLGGGLFTDGTGTASISNSTFANNTGGTSGGGLFNNGPTMTISNSTFANNTAKFGGGLANVGTLNISGSIVANNTGDECNNLSPLTDQGYNLSDDSSCGLTASTDLNTNPKLDPNGLQNNGGPTQTIALLDGSPAINQIPASSCPATDQRGISRPQGPACDIGAFEFRAPTLNLPSSPLTVNATSDQGATVTYTATGTEPDDSSATPTVNCTPASGSVFPIGTTTVNCTASDAANPPDTTTGSFQVVVVGDNDLALTNMPANMTVNATSPQGAVVTYTPPTVVDEDSPLPPVNCTPASGSTFAIGATTVTCTVSDSDDLNSPVSASFQVTVQPVLAVSVTSVNATEGSAFNGVVATGTAYGASSPLSASITWGDGSSSTGSVTLNPDGSYNVSGSHTYAEEGSFTLSVSVKDSGSLSATGSGSAKVADAALTLTHFVAGPLGHRAAGVAATFTDADPAGQVSDYTATITWGNGSTSTVKVIKNPLGKGFVLAGLHSYASSGKYAVTLTVSDSGGSQLTKTVTLTVK